MMSNWKKKSVAVAVAASIFTVSSTLAPRRSEAAIGVLVATMGGNPVGSVFFFVGAVGAGASSVVFFKKGWRSSGAEAFVSYLLAAACAAGAYLLLYGPEGKSCDLRSLDAASAQKLGLTEAEWKSYEQDLPLVNALREEAMARTQAELKDLEVRSEADLQKVIDVLRAHWGALSDGTLAPETHSVIQKMGHAFVAQQ